MRRLIAVLAVFVPSVVLAVSPPPKVKRDSLSGFFQEENWWAVPKHREGSAAFPSKPFVSQPVVLPFANIKVSDDTLGRPQQEPHLAVRGSNVYVVFKDWRQSRRCCSPPPFNCLKIPKLIFFARSTDSGNTWEANYQLIDSTISRRNSDPVIKVHPNGDVFACVLGGLGCAAGGGFANDTAGIFVARSTDQGVSFDNLDSAAVWPPPYTIGGDKEWMEIGPSGNIYVAWNGKQFTSSNEIIFRRSTNLGATWSLPKKLNTGVNSDGLGVQVVEGPNGAVYAIWGWDPRETGKYAIYMATSSDTGRTFSAINRRIGYQHSLDIPLVFPLPSAAVDPSNGNLYVAWPDSRIPGDSADIVFARSTNRGVNWDSSIVNSNAGDGTIQVMPIVAVDPIGRVFLMWHDTRISGGNVVDIFYTYSEDYGKTWATEQRVTTVGSVPVIDSFADRIGEYNGLAADGQALYCIWEDSRNGNQDIYFARIPTPMALWGDMDKDGVLTAADAVFLLNLVFLGEKAPAGDIWGDLNCDGFLTAADVVRHLNLIFLNQPAGCF